MASWWQNIPGLGWTRALTDVDWSSVGDWFSNKWNDLTGQTAVDKQNEANLDLAKYQTQVQEEMYNKYQSPAAIKRQLIEAGLNPNLAYGSASAGIGHAPSFNAPTVNRNLSGVEKTNAALSALSQVFSIGQGMYNMAAAKEVAQQSAIKTLSDDVKYKDSALDYILKSDLLSASVGSRRRIPYVTTDTYSRYLGEYRASKFNEFMRTGLMNIADFGGHSDYTGNLLLPKNSTLPYYDTRNKLNYLKYDLMHEIGNMGTYGKLIISLLDLLK